MVYEVDRKAWSGAKANVNEMLAQKINKPVIKKFKKRNIYARFKDHIWAADLIEMGSLCSKNQSVKIFITCDKCFH